MLSRLFNANSVSVEDHVSAYKKTKQNKIQTESKKKIK